jgi:ubiquitin carboxyl-terminal hydrolase 10
MILDVMQDYSLSFHVPLIQPRGMLNNSNTCYMNAILQPLAHCPPFYNLFNTIGQRVAFSFNSETPLVESM